MPFDFVRAEPANQSQSARLVVRIEEIDQPDQVVGLECRPAFEPDRILDTAAEFDMSVVRLARAVANPQHMARGRVPVTGRRIDTGERLLITEQKRLVAGEKIS